MRDHLFAMMARDETWTAAHGDASLLESHEESGWALTFPRRGGFRIEARDDFRGKRPLATVLRRALPPSLTPPLVPAAMRFRMIREARVIEAGGRAHVSALTVIILSRPGGGSVVTSPESLRPHVELLLSIGPPAPVEEEYRGLAIEWANGTAAVLLHEAIGHAAEHGKVDGWPEWLEVDDDPRNGMFGGVAIDDCGLPARASAIRKRGPAYRWRRASFRDVPMRRMSNLVVRANGVAAMPPRRRLRVQLASGGHYDPLTDTVVVGIVAAELIDGGQRLAVAPFTIREPRAVLARAVLGVTGHAASTPGLICIDEGQRAFVGASAPTLLTRPFAKS